ncbi:type II toxin-antitoxin system HicB family antitoxin [uncultured Anaerovibrio sp.]|uniref:type II toxin-antitoxin system HicB family antitoxin n=1 Tax=uncultured Anaerovibrio sp. TaxID=361586 RepID=UPI00261A2E88|nr:type II toxin-antitoxin system HicB family antitoxin [uncultured Anaerovibrio sp.]
MNILEYKGYHAKVEYDVESEVLHGVIDGINDYVDFVSDDTKGIVKEFHKAVDEYLDFCQEVGKEPANH